MKAYVITTAAIFGLITIAHIWRVTVERHLATDPVYIALTVATAGFCLWGVSLLRRSGRV